jgi:ABC-2 type transport system permease protein
LAIVSSFNTGEDITGEILILHLAMLFVQLIYLSLGAAFAAIMKKSKKSGTIATNILLAGYIITKITGLVEHLEVLNIFAPLNYFSLEKAVNGEGISIMIAFLCLVLVAVFSTLTYFFYQRRDMNI